MGDIARTKCLNNAPATVEQLNTVIVLVEDGHTLASACRLAGFQPNKVYAALEQSPSAQTALARARSIAADTLAQQAVDITDTEIDPRRARARSDARKWAAEMADRKRYGKQLDLNVTTHVDVAGPLAEARARARLRPISDQGDIVDAEIVDKSTANACSTGDYQSAVPDIFK